MGVSQGPWFGCDSTLLFPEFSLYTDPLLTDYHVYTATISHLTLACTCSSPGAQRTILES